MFSPRPRNSHFPKKTKDPITGMKEAPNLMEYPYREKSTKIILRNHFYNEDIIIYLGRSSFKEIASKNNLKNQNENRSQNRSTFRLSFVSVSRVFICKMHGEHKFDIFTMCLMI